MGFFDSSSITIQTHLKYQTYFPGNTVEGFVEVIASKNIGSVVGVRMEVVGWENIHLRRECRHASPNREGPTEYEDLVESNYVYRQFLCLAGTPRAIRSGGGLFSGSGPTMSIPAGRYTYPFAFTLPFNLPPSLYKRAHDDTAEIRYYVRAYVDIPRAPDASSKTHFSIIKPMPRSQWLNAAPATADRHWDITLCCCIDKGKVKARMFMDRTHISLDRDTLQVCADIDNSLGKEPVKNLEVNLMHMLSYRAGWAQEVNTLREGQHIVGGTSGGIAAGEKGRMEGRISLPRGLIPTLTTFNITSEYWIDIELSIPWASDPKHRIPVIIAQAVDETDKSPPLQWNCNPYQSLSSGSSSYSMVDDLLYSSPPPNACYRYDPIPGPGFPDNAGSIMWQHAVSTNQGTHSGEIVMQGGNAPSQKQQSTGGGVYGPASEVMMPLPQQGGWWPSPGDGTSNTTTTSIEWGTGWGQESVKVGVSTTAVTSRGACEGGSVWDQCAPPPNGGAVTTLDDVNVAIPPPGKGAKAEKEDKLDLLD